MYYGLFGSRRPREEPEPGEWQTDEKGRRFRLVTYRNTKIIEYEEVIHTTHGFMTRTQLDAYNAKHKPENPKFLKGSIDHE